MSHFSRKRRTGDDLLGRRLDEASRLRSHPELRGSFGSTADGHEPGPVALHLGVGIHPVSETTHDLGRDRIRRLRHAIVNPLAFTATRDNAGASKVRKMARNLRLALAEGFDEKTDTDLVATDDVEKTQARSVAKRLKEAFDVLCCCCHAS